MIELVNANIMDTYLVECQCYHYMLRSIFPNCIGYLINPRNFCV